MAQKSKEKITETLLKLMKQHPFHEITISEICAYANIARRTFYNNFQSKEEVISLLCQKMIDEHMSSSEAENQFWQKKFVVNFFVTNRKNHAFFDLLFKQDLFHIYTNELHKRMSNYSEIVSTQLSKGVDTACIPYVVPSYTASALKFYEIWSKNDFQESPEEIAEIYLNVMHYESQLSQDDE